MALIKEQTSVVSRKSLPGGAESPVKKKFHFEVEAIDESPSASSFKLMDNDEEKSEEELLC